MINHTAKMGGQFFFYCLEIFLNLMVIYLCQHNDHQLFSLTVIVSFCLRIWPPIMYMCTAMLKDQAGSHGKVGSQAGSHGEEGSQAGSHDKVSSQAGSHGKISSQAGSHDKVSSLPHSLIPQLPLVRLVPMARSAVCHTA